MGSQTNTLSTKHLIIQRGTHKSDHINALSNQCFVKLQPEKKKVKKAHIKHIFSVKASVLHCLILSWINEQFH